MSAVIYTNEELRAKCAEWQKILRLQDWDIRTSIVRAREMQAEDSNAECKVNIQHRLAQIKIVDPVDFHTDELNPQDMERYLVHELLHIHLWPFTENLEGPLEDAEEQAINMIAGALIQLHRKQ